MSMKYRRKITGAVVLLLLVAGIVVWNCRFAATRIAFVNYQGTTLGQIAKANNSKKIKLVSLDVDNLGRLHRYDLVLINGMGLRITAEERAILEKAGADGLPIITTMATNPANNIVTTDSVVASTVASYLSGGGRTNYRNMLAYVRRSIDRKSFGVEQPAPPSIRRLQMFYHIDPRHPDLEEKEFSSVADYNAFAAGHGLLLPDAPRIIITGQMADPTQLIDSLELTGNVVYPVRNIQKLITSGQIDSIQPSAIINMAHGRLGDFIVDYLKKQNIPLFAPLNTNTLADEWESDRMGMNGGFMSQSVVMPEIDGAIRPYALFGHYTDADGLQCVQAIPGRLSTFVATVNNHIALRHKSNADKRIVIYYYKGPGQNALTAAGMEVAPSLFNLLQRMKREGYTIDMPQSVDQLEAIIQRQGSVFNAYADGAKADFLVSGNPLLIDADHYIDWTTRAIRSEKMAEVDVLDGPFPGSYISTADGRLALPRVELGNVVLMPQLAAGAGDDDFAIVHGTNAAPPHAYIAQYLWARYCFDADAILHFGTHGSLEFTPGKQVALCSADWADALVGSTPHLYIYSIADVGEGLIAKRRSYATLQSHLTPPFMESNVRGIYSRLTDAIQEYNSLSGSSGSRLDAASLKVKRLTVSLGIHRELRLDSILDTPYSEQEIVRIENFAEELANEKITGAHYVMGVPYTDGDVNSSVYAMTVEPIAYSLLALDKWRGTASPDAERHKSLFASSYLRPARTIVGRLLSGADQPTDELICSTAGITPAELERARTIYLSLNAPQDMMARMMAMRQSGGVQMQHPAGIPRSQQGGAKHPSRIPHVGKRPDSVTGKGVTTSQSDSATQAQMVKVMEQMFGNNYTGKEKEHSRIVMEICRAMTNVEAYRRALITSPEAEMASLINAMSGGYTVPSAGGDPIANPASVPTGRNLYAINAEATPSEVAWERGKQLADNTIKLYRSRHNDSIPRKVSYTLWSGEFVETEGATIAQVLYMLGVEPVRDVFGRVNDLRLIPSDQLGRPRIDVVVQTSGQLRDIAASRLFLISRAVEMAAAAHDDTYPNYVASSVVDAEKTLIDKGVAPKDARTMSAYRVFGGANGNYGTGITSMVQSGDRWESADEIARVYIQNMGAYYGSQSEWQKMNQVAFETALVGTDAVVQPRQSNTWGALSLDHVYEFMGGMNLAVKKVTGRDPDAYMSDYRNRNNMRMQELKEAIGVESRTTILNPHYIKEKMKGSASSAASFAEVIQNTYGWNVMKPDVIDHQLWDDIYSVYVDDKFDLGIHQYFERQNPAALQEITAVMLETARKGMWQATDVQLQNLAQLHQQLVEKYRPSCSGTVCDNGHLRQFIASNLKPETAARYRSDIDRIRHASVSSGKSTVLKRQSMSALDETTTEVSNIAVVVIVVIALVVIVILLRTRQKIFDR